MVLMVFAFIAAALGAPSDNVDVRIIGGSDADISDYPYTLQLEYMDELVCGAVLVSPNYALTSGHCCVNTNMEYFLVRAGSSILYEGGQELSVKQVIYHPLFNSGNDYYGVALLLLSGSVTDAQPIQLATNDDAIVEGASLRVVGWGWLDFTYEAEFSTTLQVIDLPILSDVDCDNSYDIVAIDVMFCAAYLEGAGRGRCNGDNGGPAVIDGVLAGIPIFGSGCGDGTHAGAYIRASKIKDWVDGYIAS